MSINQKNQIKSEFNWLINDITIERLKLVKDNKETSDIDAIAKLLMSEKMIEYEQKTKEVLIIE